LARGRRALEAVREVGHEEREGVGEGTPGQPLAEEELHEDVRGHNDGGHGKDAGDQAAGHVGSVLTRSRRLGPGNRAGTGGLYAPGVCRSSHSVIRRSTISVFCTGRKLSSETIVSLSPPAASCQAAIPSRLS